MDAMTKEEQREVFQAMLPRTEQERLAVTVRVGRGDIQWGVNCLVLATAVPPLIPILYPYGIYKIIRGWRKTREGKKAGLFVPWNVPKYSGVSTPQ